MNPSQSSTTMAPNDSPDRISVPRDATDNYTAEAAATRRAFITAQTGVELDHVGSGSVDPALLPGNIENVIGVAQVPIGLAGPLRVQGEHAQGDFYIPMATTEGTLVASYNRGMRLIHACGGVHVTVVDDAMQRAPVFICNNARDARALGAWIDDNMSALRDAAATTTRVGRLRNIEHYAVGPLRFLRMNYTTGDAAGQNMVTKATLAVCQWIHAHCPIQSRYNLSGSLGTDKKHSHINTLHTRGKRVIAEITLPDALVQKHLRVSTQTLFEARQIYNTGALLSGAALNGAHTANALAALFIATGQDVANVAESHAGTTYCQRLENGDYYWSLTMFSVIVATYGGGTGLPTQRECLEMLGCYGTGKVNKFAEIVGATALAGELSLSAAILAGDWVSSHEEYGRNR